MSASIEEFDATFDANSRRKCPMVRSCRWTLRLRYSGTSADRIPIAEPPARRFRLRQIDSYDSLVDVLQRVGHHPATRVSEFTRYVEVLRSPLNNRRANTKTVEA